MDLSVSTRKSALAFGGLIALTICAGTMQATTLTATATVAVNCNTATGPGTTGTIVVKPATALAGSSTIVVTFAAPGGGLIVTAPGTTTLSTANQTAGLSYTVATAPGCVANTTGATTIQFKAGGVNDVTSTVNDTVTSTNSGLVAPNVTVTCARNPVGPVYTPGPAQKVSVTSAATGGTPFTVDNTTNPPANWLTVSSYSGGTAGANPIVFTVAAAAGCGSFGPSTSNTTTLHLLNTPAPDKLVTVTLLVLPPSPLTVTPVPAAPSISLTYVKGSGAAATANVSVSSSVAGAFFSVSTASLPTWLTVNSTAGTATAPLAFSTTGVADTLSPGTYTAVVYLKVSGYADLATPITLLVTNKAPKLTVSSTSLPISWTVGSVAPTATITAYSTDSPVQYSIVTGGTLAPIVSATHKSGLAYSFGTQIAVTFNPLTFATAIPGQVLTGTVTFNWGNPVSTTVVTISVTVVSPGATLTSISPATVPTATSGTSFQISLTGSGFVGGSDATLKTRVGIVVGGVIVPDTNFSVFVQNPSNMILTITVPGTADANLPFAPAGINGVVGGSVFLGVVNGVSTTPTGTATLTIGAGPVIQGAASASSFVQVTPPALPTFAPYDMVSLFGANFCASGGTGCSSAQLLNGIPDALTLRFPMTLTPDAVNATNPRYTSVSFFQHNTNTLIANAPLLFVTNGQVNLIVPGAVASSIGSVVDMAVNFGYGSGSTLLKSNLFPVNIAATDPGVFTVGFDGQGAGAALSTSWALITNTNPAGMRTGAHAGPDSDTIQLYVTGLGTPDSSADNTSTGTGTVSTDCIGATSGTGNFMSSLQSATSVSPSLTNIDGAVIQGALLNTGRLPPCLTTLPTVDIGGVTGTVTYAGFVADTVAGLYQINVQLPASTGTTFYPNYPLTSLPLTAITAPVQLPVHVTVGGVTSQDKVTVWVNPRLLLTGPTGSALDATVGIPWTGTVTAYEGTGAYRYAVTSGVLPSGLTLAPSTGVISGTPNANTGGVYAVTITATDSANVPVTGAYSMTINVAGGLFVTFTGSGSPLTTQTFGTASGTITTVAATGGTYPYTYAITTPATPPTGMVVDASGHVSTSVATPAGTYNGVVVTATDSGSTPLTGAATFQLKVNLKMTTVVSPTPQTNGTNGVLYQVNATGYTGAITYTLQDIASSGATALAIDSSGNVTPGTAVAGTYTFTVTATDDTMAPGATAVASGITNTITVVVQ
jgi:hypothetical protein